MTKEQADLEAAVSTLATAVSGATAEMSDLVSKVLGALNAPAGVDAGAVESAATSIGTLAGNLNDAVKAAQTALAPPSAA